MSTNTIIPLSWYQQLRVRSVLTKSLVDRRVMTVLIGVGVGIMAFLVAAMFPAMQDTLAEFDLGPAFDSFFGAAGMSTPEGWLSTEVFSIMAPGAIVALVIVDAARSIASEMEDLSIGLLASNPISRTRVMTEKSMAIVFHCVVASALIGLFTWLGVVVINLDMDPNLVWSAALSLALLGFMVAGTAALFAVVIGKRAMAMIAVGGIAFVAYMVSVLLPINADLADWAKLSPWYYYWGDSPLVNGINWVNLGVMATIGLVMFLLAVLVFRRKDLRG
jgi:beta-exotoxin I transport system permease protein